MYGLKLTADFVRGCLGANLQVRVGVGMRVGVFVYVCGCVGAHVYFACQLPLRCFMNVTRTAQSSGNLGFTVLENAKAIAALSVFLGPR
jgi:hypothetical protein